MSEPKVHKVQLEEYFLAGSIGAWPHRPELPEIGEDGLPHHAEIARGHSRCLPDCPACRQRRHLRSADPIQE